MTMSYVKYMQSNKNPQITTYGNKVNYLNQQSKPTSYFSYIKYVPKDQEETVTFDLPLNGWNGPKSKIKAELVQNNDLSGQYSSLRLSVPTSAFNYTEVNEESLKGLAALFEAKGVPVQITSLRREGATTSNGSRSYHADGKAMDIVPKSGDFGPLLQLLRNDEEVRSAMSQIGIGYINETTKEMLARTGGTGAHIHFGEDKLAIKHFNDRA